MLVAPWNEIWVTREVAMKLSERIEHFKKHQLEVGDEYGAEVLHHANERIAQLKADLRASRLELGLAVTERVVIVLKYNELEAAVQEGDQRFSDLQDEHACLEAENEMFQELFVYFFGENYERIK